MVSPRALWTAGALSALVVGVAVWFGTHRGKHPTERPANGPPGSYVRGTLLRYLPEQCASYRIYVDLKGVTETLELRDVLTSERVPGPWKTAFQTFEAAHLRVGQEIEDLAVCAEQSAEGEDDEATSKTYVAIGGAFGGREALSKYKGVIEGLTRAKDADVVEHESNGVPYLVSSYSTTRKWIAMPAPDVLVFYTDAVAEVGALAKSHDVDARAWQLEGGTLASFERRQKDEEATAGETARSLWGTVSLEGDRLLLEARSALDPATSVTPDMLASLQTRLADTVAGSSFPGLADPVRQMKLEVGTRSVHVRLEVPVAKIIEAGATASTHREAVPELFTKIRRISVRR